MPVDPVIEPPMKPLRETMTEGDELNPDIKYERNTRRAKRSSRIVAEPPQDIPPIREEARQEQPPSDFDRKLQKGVIGEEPERLAEEAIKQREQHEDIDTEDIEPEVVRHNYKVVEPKPEVIQPEPEVIQPESEVIDSDPKIINHKTDIIEPESEVYDSDPELDDSEYENTNNYPETPEYEEEVEYYEPEADSYDPEVDWEPEYEHIQTNNSTTNGSVSYDQKRRQERKVRMKKTVPAETCGVYEGENPAAKKPFETCDEMQERIEDTSTAKNLTRKILTDAKHLGKAVYRNTKRTLKRWLRLTKYTYDEIVDEYKTAQEEKRRKKERERQKHLAELGMDSNKTDS